jgi:cytochrome c
MVTVIRTPARHGGLVRLKRAAVVGALLLAFALPERGTDAHVVMQRPGHLEQDDVPAFVVQARCVACHEEREARIGPPYFAIALRYAKADDTTVELLAQKIVSGGSGNWGQVPMVANPQVTLDQAREVVRWILARKVD